MEILAKSVQKTTSEEKHFKRYGKCDNHKHVHKLPMWMKFKRGTPVDNTPYTD